MSLSFQHVPYRMNRKADVLAKEIGELCSYFLSTVRIYQFGANYENVWVFKRYDFRIINETVSYQKEDAIRGKPKYYTKVLAQILS